MNARSTHRYLPSIIVNDQIIQLKNAGRNGRAQVHVADPQRCPNTGQKLRRAKGLGDVIVGPKIQCGYLVLFIRSGRQDDNGDHAAAADNADKLLSVHIRQPQIQHHQIRYMRRQHQDTLLTPLGGQNLISIGIQNGLNRTQDAAIILHNKNFVLIVRHGLIPPFQE